MSIRKGVEAIGKRNNEETRRVGLSTVPELVLYDDGDQAVMRFLTDDPLDVDMHDARDPKTTSNRPVFAFCTRDESGTCEGCTASLPLTRLFSFWVYVYKILHRNPDDEHTWKEVKIGSKNWYEEPINSVLLLRRKFGKANEMWNQFDTAYENFGTWKDREYSFKRNGGRGDINTRYVLSPLDKSPIPKELAVLIGKLPSLESVARGKVTKLDIATVETPSSQPKKVVEIPDEGTITERGSEG